MLLATDLMFKDVIAVAGLLHASHVLSYSDTVESGQLPPATQKGYVTRHGTSICVTGLSLAPRLLAGMGRSQRFLGSWTFNAKRVRATLLGSELGFACSSYVEFHAMLHSCNNLEG